MAARELPEQAVLLQLLRYDADTGKLFWRERGVGLFPSVTPARSRSLCALWNARYADKEAFTTLSDGYCTGSIFGSNYKAHRIIWRMITGEEPEQIDHDNGNRSDNRWGNLLDVNHSGNMRNRRIPGNNKTGVMGVHKLALNGHVYWVATAPGEKQLYFKTFDEAVAARSEMVARLGFHENHGRVA